MELTEAKQIPRSVCNRHPSRKDLKMRPICLTEYDKLFILDEIKVEKLLNMRYTKVLIITRNISHEQVFFK